jgi:hypothetical protein
MNITARVCRSSALMLGLVVALLATFAQPASAQFISIKNPVVSQRADTAIYKHSDGYYYMTASVPDYKRVELRRSTTLQGLGRATAASPSPRTTPPTCSSTTPATTPTPHRTR